MLTKITRLVTIFLTICSINSLNSMQKPENAVYKKWDTQKKTIVLKKDYKGNLPESKTELKRIPLKDHPKALELVKKNTRDQFLKSFSEMVRSGLVGVDPEIQWGHLKTQLAKKTVELLEKLQKAAKSKDTKLEQTLHAMADAIDELEWESGFRFEQASSEIKKLFVKFPRAA